METQRGIWKTRGQITMSGIVRCPHFSKYIHTCVIWDILYCKYTHVYCICSIEYMWYTCLPSMCVLRGAEVVEVSVSTVKRPRRR